MDYAAFPTDALPKGHHDCVSLLLSESARYKDLVLEYCNLALSPSLNETQQAQMEAILLAAVKNPLLSLWIDEADHWVAHRLHLMDETFLQQQQAKLRQVLSQPWIDAFWADLQHCTKTLQLYLSRLGIYAGAIDGVMGPMTEMALETWRHTSPGDLALD